MNNIYFTVTLVILEIIFSLMVLKALHRAAAKKSTLLAISLVFTVWLASMYCLLTNKIFTASGMPQITFTLGVVIPIILGYLASVLWRPLNKAIKDIPTKDFLFLQIWRAAFGIMFFFTSELPAWFQYIGGLGDIAAGLGSFLALLAWQKRAINECHAIIHGNLIGILDFIVVLNLGVFVVLKNQSPDIMFDLIPLYVVPIFILLHIFSLQRLKSTCAKNAPG